MEPGKDSLHHFTGHFHTTLWKEMKFHFTRNIRKQVKQRPELSIVPLAG